MIKRIVGAVFLCVLLWSSSAFSALLYYTFEGHVSESSAWEDEQSENILNALTDKGYTPGEYLKYVFLIDFENPLDDFLGASNVESRFYVNLVYFSKNYTEASLENSLYPPGGTSITTITNEKRGSLRDEVQVSGHGFVEDWSVGLEVLMTDYWGVSSTIIVERPLPLLEVELEVVSLETFLVPLGSGYLTNISSTFDPLSVPIPSSASLVFIGLLTVLLSKAKIRRERM